MKFTKAQRHKIYKVVIENDVCHNGICHVIVLYLLVAYGVDIFCTHVPDYFPELRKRKPKHDLAHWWPLNDRESRLKVLRACIRETAPKKLKKKK